MHRGLVLLSMLVGTVMLGTAAPPSTARGSASGKGACTPRAFLNFQRYVEGRPELGLV